MGIRMLHRRTAPARTQAQAHADNAPSVARRPVPAHAAAASTARVPRDLTTLLRRATDDLRHRFARRDRDDVDQEPEGVSQEPSRHRLWAELALGYLALALTLLPRARPMPTMTVFVATTDTVIGRPEGRPLPGHRTPEQGATA
ncbi:hypothetical protein ACI2L1_32990 [Streptomyces sp. NPDC019531]|uniref:hypothetical protein n=1 Tax=Streptomyces sp. NPDC019531 TaxID=3365062 RepID=UPI00384E582C